MAARGTSIHHSPPQALPSISTLTNGLSHPSARTPPGPQNGTLQSRDSGTWPAPQSKHASMNNPSLQVSTLLNPDDSHPRNSVPSTPTSARAPQASSALPSINQGFDPTNHHRGSVDYHPSIDSRRSSVDSRMHVGFTNLVLNNPTSPYESQNASQVSLAASLRRPNGATPMSPLSGRNSMRAHHPAPRIAPPIAPLRQPGAPDPMAAKPTQGFAWAFPESAIAEEQQRRGSSSDDSYDASVSRQNSFAASSIRSSILSMDSHLPPGQRRFEEDPATTHHHSMQHRAVSSLQNEQTPTLGGGNYSRTPELRVSHKLAERKRRSEMKDLFEELNKAVPANGGAKASKWEILTKAIDYIRGSQMQERNLQAELGRLRQEAEFVRESAKENELLRTEILVMHERLRRLDPNNAHIYGQYTSQLTQNQAQANPQPPPFSLPPPIPMNSVAPQQQYNSMAPSAAMQGVEYGAPPRGAYDMVGR